jgi:hypothetical protein
MRRIIIAIIVLMMVSCAPASPDTLREQANFRKGVQGLSLSFMHNSPPTRVFDADTFMIGLEVRNLGATDLRSEDWSLWLTGFDTSLLTVNSITSEEIFGKSLYNSQGGYFVHSSEASITRDKITDKYTPTIMATACYRYSTIASGDVCIDPKPYETGDRQKACTPTDLSFSEGQGGPIAVTNIFVEPSSNHYTLTFYIRNSGGGMVYDVSKGISNPCTKIELDERNKIKVSDVKLGGQSIKASCKPSLDSDNARLTLSDGQAVLFCRTPDNYLSQQDAAFVTPVTIELEYGYRSSTSRRVEIISSPNQ